jgi:hypothetical protein
MPSGFQQDINQLKPGYYRVVVTLSGGTGNYNAAAPKNGAVNPYDWNAYTVAPTTLANSERLVRGNLRWQAIIEELTKKADAQILDVEVSSANVNDANSIPTALAFTVRYDREEFVLEALAGTNDILGNVIDATAKAVKHLVVTGIQRGGQTGGYSRSYRVFDPVDSTEFQKRITIESPVADAAAYADVAVNLLDGTELISKI